MKRRNRRGQAITELALGSLIVVVMLAGGLYLTEVSNVELKVHEAAAFAVYHSMSMGAIEPGVASTSEMNRVHGAGPTKPAGRANNHYAGLINGNQIYSQTTGLNVQCFANQTIQPARLGPPVVATEWFNVLTSGEHNLMATHPIHAAPYAALRAQLNSIFPNVGGTSCRATAFVSPFGMPPMAVSPSELSGPPPPALPGVRVCSPGRAVGGACIGSYALLVGDYGFSVTPNDLPNRSADCLLNECTNTNYRNVVRSLYQANIGAISALRPANNFVASRGLTNPMPGNGELQFYMSFSGEEHDYMDGILPNARHNTSGVNTQGRPNEEVRDWNGCWAGQGGRATDRAWDNPPRPGAPEGYVSSCL